MGKAVRRGPGIHNRNISDGAGILSHKMDLTYQNEAAFLEAKSATGLYPDEVEVGDMFYSLDAGVLLLGDVVTPGSPPQFIPIGGEETNTTFQFEFQIPYLQTLAMGSIPFLLFRAPPGKIIDFLGAQLYHKFSGSVLVPDPGPTNWNFEVQQPGFAFPSILQYSVSTAIPEVNMKNAYDTSSLTLPESTTKVTTNTIAGGQMQEMWITATSDFTGGDANTIWNGVLWYHLIDLENG